VITKTASPSLVTPGGVVTYHITVKNRGVNDAGDVIVADKPSADAVVVSVEASAGKCGTSLPVICRLGTVKPGASVHITLRLQPTQQSRGFKNTAVVGTSTYDPALANNIAHATVAVVAPPPVAGFG
jgi:uncharacterized repeat protein (TIGR01451 family)